MSSNPPFLPVDSAAVSWTDSGGGIHIRVYATGGYTLNERCFDNGVWTTGSLSQSATVVSATSWTDGNGLHIRVYATAADATTEWCLDGESNTNWYQGQYTTS